MASARMVGQAVTGHQPPGRDVRDHLRADLLERGDAGGQVDLELRGHARQPAARAGDRTVAVARGARLHRSAITGRGRRRSRRRRRPPPAATPAVGGCRRRTRRPTAAARCGRRWRRRTRQAASVHADRQLDAGEHAPRGRAAQREVVGRRPCRATAGRRATSARTARQPTTRITSAAADPAVRSTSPGTGSRVVHDPPRVGAGERPAVGARRGTADDEQRAPGAPAHVHVSAGQRARGHVADPPADEGCATHRARRAGAR